MATPLTPAEAKKNKNTTLHPSMVEAVNYFLLNYDGHQKLIINQQKLVEKFLELEPSYTQQRVYEENLLDIESTFRKHGWKIKYDKPAYDESYVPFFIFSE